jgi:hypothetical protein
MTNWVESYFDNNPEIASLPIAARSRFSLHLRRGNRQRLALITGAPMHYYSSSSREWFPIDTRLQPLADGRFGAPGLPFALDLDGSVSLNDFPYKHRTWRVGIFAKGKFAEQHRFSSSFVARDRLVRETSLLRHEIILLPSGLREELILKEAPKQMGETGDLFAVETLLSSDSPLSLGPSIAMAPGWAQDAAGRRIPLMHWLASDDRRFYSGLPVDWLAEARYPVIIDPDIDITGSTADGYIEGSSVTTSTLHDATSTTISVGGRNVGGTPKLWRGYLKFNTSSLGSAATVQKVNLRMFPTALNNYLAWTIYVRQYDWSANDPMASGSREAAWDGLLAASNAAVLATSADSAGTPVTSQDLPTSWVQTEGNTYYGLYCNQEGYTYPINQGGQHQYSSADHATPSQRPLLMIEYLGSYPLSGPIPLRATALAPSISLPDTRVILRSRPRRTALNTRIT